MNKYIFKIILLLVTNLVNIHLFAQVTAVIQPATNCTNNGSIKLSAINSTTFSYNWSYEDKVGILSQNFANTATIQNLAEGKYCVTVLDINCCIAKHCFQVKDESQIPVPLAWEIVPATSCTKEDGKLNALFDGTNPTGITLECFWFRNLNWVSVAKSDAFTPIQWSNLAVGDYKVVVTNASGCTGEREFKITAPDEIKVSTDGLSPCKGQKNGSIKVNVTPQNNVNYDISILGPNGQPFIAKNTYSATYNNVGAGNYTITVHKAGNPDFCTKILQYELKEDVFSASDIIATVKHPCKFRTNGRITMDYSKFGVPYTVKWELPVPVSKQSWHSPWDLSAGIYTVNVTNQCGKKVTKNFELIEIDNKVSLNAVLNSDCTSDIVANSTTSLNLPIKYAFDKEMFGTVSDNKVKNVKGSGGTVNVKATDSNGCIVNQSLLVETPYYTFNGLAACAGSTGLLNI